MDLVEVELFVSMGAMAWASTISKKRDSLGKEMYVPAHDYTTYLISRPKPFPFEMKPRSENKARLVRDNHAVATQRDAMEAATVKVRMSASNEAQSINAGFSRAHA